MFRYPGTPGTLLDECMMPMDDVCPSFTSMFSISSSSKYPDPLEISSLTLIFLDLEKSAVRGFHVFVPSQVTCAHSVFDIPFLNGLKTVESFS